jgi:hypothetical protein
MERPFVNDIEAFITEFVKSIGGKTVIETVDKQPDFNNADFIFEKENILIELKCLEKDLFSDKDFERNERLIDKWLSEGKLRKVDMIPMMLGKKQLPKECQMELLLLCRNTLQTIIKKGNRQLRETRKQIGNEKTEKVLFICNDGNYFLSDILAFDLINHIHALLPESEIDCFVLFTVNQTSRIPNSEIDWSCWMPAYGSKASDNLCSFINDFGKRFHEFYNFKFNITNSEHRVYNDPTTGYEAIREHKHIPKEIIYKK